MAVILSISSQVVRGHVGNSALAPGLSALGHELWPLPTVVLSNHPGHGAAAGETVPAQKIAAMVETLAGHGWLERCDGVMTGYFRDADQVAAAADAVAAVKAARADALYCCDPVLGDEPAGLYVPPAVAEAVRDRLVPQADLATPNRFELGWLTGKPVDDRADAVAACRALAPRHLLAKSLYDGEGPYNLWHDGGTVSLCRFEDREDVPHGVGDLMAGLAFAAMLAGADGARALGVATAQIGHVIGASAGRDELDMVRGLAAIATVTPSPVSTFDD